MIRSKNNKLDSQSSEIHTQDLTRRKAVKTLMGGVAALTVYSALPTNWSKPVLEQVFLPAHAATSGTTGEEPQGPCPITLQLSVSNNVSGAPIPSGGTTSSGTIVRYEVSVSPVPAPGTQIRLYYANGTSDLIATSPGGVAGIGISIDYGSVPEINQNRSRQQVYATYDCATSSTWTQTILP